MKYPLCAYDSNNKRKEICEHVHAHDMMCSMSHTRVHSNLPLRSQFFDDSFSHIVISLVKLNALNLNRPSFISEMALWVDCAWLKVTNRIKTARKTQTGKSVNFWRDKQWQWRQLRHNNAANSCTYSSFKHSVISKSDYTLQKTRKETERGRAKKSVTLEQH